MNFSVSGWMQVNTAMFFNSGEWHAAFVAQFDALRDYAWTNLRGSRLMAAPPAGVTIGPSLDANAPKAPSSWQPTSPKPAKKAAKKSPKLHPKTAGERTPKSGKKAKKKRRR